ncbi:hypothetical protein [Cytobacillus pseudoceanisediminis]|uniref:hypothetical protein n=1 Tax=Cytobacillus pseudoceanisediminis TaxID=3051614 RepID=UPI002161317B|nr:hypothetical protein [Cytobacillus firmus]
MSYYRWHYIGWLIFGLTLIVSYFTVPHKYGFTTIMVLTALFAIYDLLIMFKAKRWENNNRNQKTTKNSIKS